MELEYIIKYFRKISNQFYENPYGVSRVVPCQRTDGQTEERRDMTMIAFRSFAKVPRKEHFC